MKKVMMLVAAALLLAGCGEKKVFFVSQEGNALQKGASVVWYDAYVGRVRALEDVADGTKVSVGLGKKFAEEIRDGVTGRVVNDPKISPKAFVLLVGGRDKDRSLVEDGAQIPESKPGNAIGEGFSAFVEWLKNSRAERLVVAGVVVLALFVFVKFVGKLLKFVFFLGILGVIGYMCLSTNADWGKYKGRLATVKESAQEAKTWLQQHGEKLHAILKAALENSGNN